MKTQILLIVILLHNLFAGYAQEMKLQKSIVTKTIFFDKVEQGWTQEKNKWFYNGETVNFVPATYCSVETIDSTLIFEQSTIKKNIQIKEESTGFYETIESDWKWNDEAWYYKGKIVKSFPPSFTKKTTIITTTYDLDSKEVKNQEKIKEETFYEVKSESWKWDINDGCWLLHGKKNDLLPSYDFVRSVKQYENH